MIELEAPSAQEYGEKLMQAGRLWLFLDYDGTLAGFAQTPDTVLPDPELIDLLSRLAKYPDLLRVVILSGRKIGHIQKLLPVQGILEAGTYGIEFVTWQGEEVRLLDFATGRPFLDQLKQRWAEIIAGTEFRERPGYYLEDKEYSLAIHARFAPEAEARETLSAAERAARQLMQPDTYRILGGDRFLELAPLIANKGQSVSMLLRRFPWPGADIVYIGDDDKDEEAFKVVLENGGAPILVAAEPRESVAQYRLQDPAEVLRWLGELVRPLEEKAGNHK